MCSSFAIIYEIQREKFLEILKENDKDYEKFNMIKDEIIQKDHSKYYQRTCLLCKDSNHFE